MGETVDLCRHALASFLTFNGWCRIRRLVTPSHAPGDLLRDTHPRSRSRYNVILDCATLKVPVTLVRRRAPGARLGCLSSCQTHVGVKSPRRVSFRRCVYQRFPAPGQCPVRQSDTILRRQSAVFEAPPWNQRIVGQHRTIEPHKLTATYRRFPARHAAIWSALSQNDPLVMCPVLAVPAQHPPITRIVRVKAVMKSLPVAHRKGSSTGPSSARPLRSQLSCTWSRSSPSVPR